MQDELKALQRALGITFVFVTHDQGEALSMADRVAVFNDGRIVQVGTPGGDLRAAAHPLRRRFRRLLQRAAAASSPTRSGAAAPGRASAGEDPRRRAPRAGGRGDGRASSDHRQCLFSGRRHPHRSLAADGADARVRPSRRRPRICSPARASGCRSAVTALHLMEPSHDGAALAGAPPSPGDAAPRLLRRASRTSSGAARGCCCAAAGAARCSGSASSMSARSFALLLQSFFSIDEFSGLVDPRVHARDLCRAVPAGQSRHHRAHRADGAAVTLASARHRLPDRLLRGALCHAARWKALFYLGGDAAALVELSGQGLCLEADPRQGGHPHLALQQGCGLVAGCSTPGSPSPVIGGTVAVGQLSSAPSSSSSMSGCPS